MDRLSPTFLGKKYLQYKIPYSPEILVRKQKNKKHFRHSITKKLYLSFTTYQELTKSCTSLKCRSEAKEEERVPRNQEIQHWRKGIPKVKTVRGTKQLLYSSFERNLYFLG